MPPRREPEDVDTDRFRRLEDAMIALAENATGRCREHDNLSVFDKFNRHHPPTYDGAADPMVLESWIRELEKLFEATGCSADQKIPIGTYYLQGEADNWWSTVKDSCVATPGFGWEQFKAKLKVRFYPEELQWQKQEEFLRFEQGSLTVQQYADKFTALSRFAPEIVTSEAIRVRRFEKGLHPEVRRGFAGIRSHTFQEAYERALSVYADIQEIEAAKAPAKRPFVSSFSQGQGSAKRQTVAYRSQGGYSAPRIAFQQRGDPNCPRCKKLKHPGKDCSGVPLKCFVCGAVDHKAWQCPRRVESSSSGAQGKSGGVQGGRSARVYVMTQEEADANPGIISGTFPVNKVPAYVIFDTGAERSFVSSKFARKAEFVGCKNEPTLVTLPNGAGIPCLHSFDDVIISIAGKDFSVDLIEFDLMEFDVILGMDWLVKYRAQFECREQKVSVVSPTGGRVSYRGLEVRPSVRWVSALKMDKLRRKGHPVYLCCVRDLTLEEKLEAIPVVREFPDVFPEDLPGLPPQRDVEFSIDVMPGTGPISKAPYRMAPAELQELKKQLGELIQSCL